MTNIFPQPLSLNFWYDSYRFPALEELDDLLLLLPEEPELLDLDDPERDELPETLEELLPEDRLIPEDLDELLPEDLFTLEDLDELARGAWRVELEDLPDPTELEERVRLDPE